MRGMSEELPAPEANRLFYADLAAEYDRTERCAFSPGERSKLRRAIERALREAGSAPRALDAGGGTGNAASILLELGVNPLIVDISPEMLAVWRAKAAGLGREPRTKVAELEEFLREDTDTWDLIVFSSVLHHLEEPDRVLELATARLAPGGVILTMFDPTLGTRALRALRKADWAIWAVLHYPRRALELVRGRLRRARGDRSVELQVGRRAERHAYQGLPDDELVATMSSRGMEILEHSRTFDARYLLVRLAMRALSRPSTFSLLLRRPDPG
jgi:SAM-dependent methyltransferase